MKEDNTVLLCSCPRRESLYFYEQDGVFHYQHKDKTYCTPLEALGVPVQDVLHDLGKMERIITPTLKASYVCSLPLRLDYYKAIAEAEPVRLEKLLVRITELMEDAYNIGILVWELRQVFGLVIFENLAKVTRKQYQPKMKTPDAYYDLPRYQDMVNLQDSARTNTWLALEQKVRRLEEQS